MSMNQDTYRIGYESTIADKLYAGMQMDQGDVYMVTRNVTPVFLDDFDFEEDKVEKKLMANKKKAEINAPFTCIGVPFTNISFRTIIMWNQIISA